MSEAALMPTYARLPVAFERGEGVWLYDTDGNKYLDALSGIGVCNLGHCHPAVVEAIRYQSAKLIHTSNLYHIPLQEQLAEALTSASGMSQVFFCNSGAEANEAAIKMARLYGHEKGIEEPAIVVMDGAFHGRTLATLTATGNRKVQAGFEPLVQGFVRAPFNDPEAVRAIARNNPNVVAVLVEPVQGEGGVNCPDPDYLNQLREICDTHEWLLMLDEVQTGNGRTGRYFAFQHNGIVPDVLSTAKGLANGIPMGATLAHGKAAGLLKPGSHGTTYGGNPLACAAALAVHKELTNGLIEQAQQTAEWMFQRFQEAFAEAPYIQRIQHKGMMFGIQLNQPCSELVLLAKAKGILINVTAESVVRLLPPLVINQDEARLLTETLIDLITTFTGDR